MHPGAPQRLELLQGLDRAARALPQPGPQPVGVEPAGVATQDDVELALGRDESMREHVRAGQLEPRIERLALGALARRMAGTRAVRGALELLRGARELTALEQLSGTVVGDRV